MPTATCAGEALVEHFGERRFDVVHDPARCIRQMVAVTQSAASAR